MSCRRPSGIGGRAAGRSPNRWEVLFRRRRASVHRGDLRLLHLRRRLWRREAPKDVLEYPDREPDLAYEEVAISGPSSTGS